MLQPADLQLNDVVRGAGAGAAAHAAGQRRVETALAPWAPVVRADRAQLEQVLINLAFNARDAMPGGGTIRLADGLAPARPRQTGYGSSAFRSRPGEYGLDLGDRHRVRHGRRDCEPVFEPFFTTKPVGHGHRPGPGHGVRDREAERRLRLGGKHPGQGTTFTICLPEVEREAAVEPHEAVRARCPAAVQAGTVLVIEDEDGVRELAARVLQRRRATGCWWPATATRRLRELDGSRRNVDLVLTDVIVPDIGTDRAGAGGPQPVPRLPILYMSGYPRDEMCSGACSTGSSAFLQKPFTAPELTRLVDERAGRRRDRWWVSNPSVIFRLGVGAAPQRRGALHVDRYAGRSRRPPPTPFRSTAPTTSSSTSATPSRPATTTAPPSASSSSATAGPRPASGTGPATCCSRTRSGSCSPRRSRPDHPVARRTSHAHGDGVRDIALWVDDAREAFATAVERGARPAQEPTVLRDDDGEVVIAAIQTYGDTIHTLVERRNYRGSSCPASSRSTPRYQPGAGRAQVRRPLRRQRRARHDERVGQVLRAT